MFYEISLKEVEFIPYAKLAELGDFIMFYQTAVLFSKKELDYVINEIKSSLSDKDKFYVSELSYEQSLKMTENISSWIKQKGIQEDIERYEEENQKILKGTLDYIEELDRKWGDELREQKQTNKDGCTPKRKSTKATK